MHGYYSKDMSSQAKRNGHIHYSKTMVLVKGKKHLGAALGSHLFAENYA